MKNFGSDGDSVQVTAPYAVTPGDGMMVGSLFCVSTKTAAQGALTDAVTIGQFDLPALSTDVFAEGAVAYWDGALRRISTSGGTAVGVVPGGKAAGVATVRVRLTAGASSVSGAGNYQGSALPFVMPASGTVNNTAGAITTGTAFDYVIGPSYSYFPANQLFGGSPAGWYYTVWTAATIGTVYANTYLNGNAQIPAVPTPLTTVAGAYTQVTGFDVLGPAFVIAANAMGPNGCIEWHRVVNNNNSAGQKIYNTFLGATSFQGVTQTTNPKEAGMGVVRNRGVVSRQAAANAAHGDNNNASAVTKLTIDTSQAQVFGFAMQLAVATDYAMIESHGIKVFNGA